MRLAALVLGALSTLATLGRPALAAEDTIRFGVAAEPYPPFSVQDASGKWKGWEIDLMDAVCAQMKAHCEIVNVAWDGIIPALQEKKIDVIWSSMAITDERKKVIDFTNKYYETPNVLVGAKADHHTYDVTKPETLKGVTVAAQTSTSHATYLQQKFPGTVNLKLYDTLDNEVADLEAGRIDLLMAEGIQIGDLLKKPEGQAYEVKQTLPHDQLFGYGDGGGVRKDDAALRDKLNAAIKAVRDSGEYDKITRRYFDSDIYGQ